MLILSYRPTRSNIRIQRTSIVKAIQAETIGHVTVFRPRTLQVQISFIQRRESD